MFPHSGEGHPHPVVRDVTIGNDVWLAYGVTIVSGVTIGDGAVVAASSHVVKDVAPYSIVGGNPAKAIRKRFNESQIEKLLAIKWWDWDDTKIRAELPHLTSDPGSMDTFLNRHMRDV